MSKKLKTVIISIVAVVAVIAILVAVFFSSIKSLIAKIEFSINAPSVIADFEEKDEDSVRVMSFNIRYGDLGVLTAEDRYYMIEETVEKGRPDSLGVQEATPEWMAYLNENLEDYDHVGVGRDDGDDEGEYSAVFYLKDKYTAVDSGTFWLSETPDEVTKGWGADCYRICTWVILEDKATGVQYVHMNAHFDYANDEVRYNSADLILEKAKEFGDIPVVYTADMNFSEDSEYFEHMLADGYFVNTKTLAPDTMDYPTYHDRKPDDHENSKIDFVMVNDKFDAVSYRVVTAGIDGKYVSDHFPIYADIKFAD